jgi:hypothetical protein
MGQRQGNNRVHRHRGARRREQRDTCGPANRLLWRTPLRSGNASTTARAQRCVTACGAVDIAKVPPARVAHAPGLSTARSSTDSTRVNEDPSNTGDHGSDRSSDQPGTLPRAHSPDSRARTIQPCRGALIAAVGVDQTAAPDRNAETRSTPAHEHLQYDEYATMSHAYLCAGARHHEYQSCGARRLMGDREVSNRGSRTGPVGDLNQLQHRLDRPPLRSHSTIDRGWRSTCSSIWGMRSSPATAVGCSPAGG